MLGKTATPSGSHRVCARMHEHKNRHEPESHDLPGILMLIDFEKAFDSIAWSFIMKTLDLIIIMIIIMCIFI